MHMVNKCLVNKYLLYKYFIFQDTVLRKTARPADCLSENVDWMTSVNMPVVLMIDIQELGFLLKVSLLLFMIHIIYEILQFLCNLCFL